MINKIIRVGIASFIIIILTMVGYVIYTQVNNSGKQRVAIAVAPASALVEVDGKVIKDKHVLLTLGKHSYRVSYNGFRTATGEIVVRDDGVTTPIVAGLIPETSDAKKLYEEIRGEYTAVEAVAGISAEENGALFAEKNPLTRQLPYTNMLFSIGYRLDPADPTGDSIIVTIDAPPVYRTEAVTQITNWGYNPVDYKINFINESNPFV
ncbi:hypothetical protein B7Z17_02580 [Candidatus Saccharibacteria bacterium 32-49-10]|nr:MAG: hypothetical protein B7Z17_02580 [Candidatus Saccharibacteria bacterium 32-49-10]